MVKWLWLTALDGPLLLQGKQDLGAEEPMSRRAAQTHANVPSRAVDKTKVFDMDAVAIQADMDDLSQHGDFQKKVIEHFGTLIFPRPPTPRM